MNKDAWYQYFAECEAVTNRNVELVEEKFKECEVYTEKVLKKKYPECGVVFTGHAEAEYGKAGYKCHAQLFNSKYWGVPQNRERYIVVGTLDSLPDTYTYPEEQHDYVPKLSTILEADVDDKFYIADEKAHKIIDQALQRISSMGKVHATITPDRVDKRQNGRRSKEDEDPMFTLTAQDLHGVIVDDTYGYPTERERERESRKRIYTEVAPTLRSSRQGVKVVENTTKSDTEKTPPCSR